jgi:Zn-dependent oligopeptidase
MSATEYGAVITAFVVMFAAGYTAGYYQKWTARVIKAACS